MEFKLQGGVQNVLVNTGNILSLNDITKKSGQNTTQELVEALNITLKDFQNLNKTDTVKENQIIVTRPYEDLASKIAENDLSELKIGIKIFIEINKEQQLSNALDESFKVLNINYIHSVIVSYNGKHQGENKVIEKLKYIWNILEKYVSDKKIIQIGLADVDEAIFRVMYEWADVKPTIIQINLSTCCVVPPTLQSFCKDNDVQLLTHSDPNDILPEESVQNLFGSALKLMWTNCDISPNNAQLGDFVRYMKHNFDIMEEPLDFKGLKNVIKVNKVEWTKSEGALCMTGRIKGFVTLLENYVRAEIEGGVPSLFRSYEDGVRMRAVFTSFATDMNKNEVGTLPC
ncbi:hypothetical protein FQA39_LY11707 [Lamprigera yunnana]|nr:hypothetical protein FQA39_LY11707 [Lamprigera yunnana]